MGELLDLDFKFKKLSTKELVPDLKKYYEDLVSTHPFVDVYVSTDSQAHNDKLVYATVIGFHFFDAFGRGKGASVVYQKYTLPRKLYGKTAKYDYEKLFSETQYSLLVAAYLEKLGISVQFIELDYNLDKKYFSNEVLLSAIAHINDYMIKNGKKYTCTYKPNATLTYAADKVSKK